MESSTIVALINGVQTVLLAYIAYRAKTYWRPDRVASRRLDPPVTFMDRLFGHAERRRYGRKG